MRIDTGKRLKLVWVGVVTTLSVGALSVAPTPVLPSAAGNSAAAAAAPYEVIFYDSFDGPLNESSSAQGWNLIVGPDGVSGHQGYDLRANVATENGLLKLSTRRHCVGSASTIPAPYNEYAGTPCPSNRPVLKYSTARLQNWWTTPPGINYEIRFSALVPVTGAPNGMRAALWAKNRADSCSKVPNGPWAEVDVMEWYPTRPASVPYTFNSFGQSTTHLTCDGTTTRREPSNAQFDRQWLEYVAQRQGRTVSYYLGSPAIGYYPIGTHTCGAGAFATTSLQRCDELLNDPVFLLIETDVFGSGSGIFAPPSPSAPFPKTDLYVDWVKITQLP